MEPTTPPSPKRLPVTWEHEPEMEEEPEPPPDDLPIEEEPASDDIKSDES